MTKIKTIYYERPKDWKKGMLTEAKDFQGSKVKKILEKISESELNVAGIELAISESEPGIFSLICLHVFYFYWGLKKDILKERLYKKQKACFCKFQKTSYGAYEDTYECIYCSCKITS